MTLQCRGFKWFLCSTLKAPMLPKIFSLPKLNFVKANRNLVWKLWLNAEVGRTPHY